MRVYACVCVCNQQTRIKFFKFNENRDLRTRKLSASGGKFLSKGTHWTPRSVSSPENCAKRNISI